VKPFLKVFCTQAWSSVAFGMPGTGRYSSAESAAKAIHRPHLLFSKCRKIREDFSHTRVLRQVCQNSSNSNGTSYDYRLITTYLRIAKEKPLLIHSISSQGTSLSFPNVPFTTVQSQNSTVEASSRSSAPNGRGSLRMPDAINKEERILWAKRAGRKTQPSSRLIMNGQFSIIRLLCRYPGAICQTLERCYIRIEDCNVGSPMLQVNASSDLIQFLFMSVSVLACLAHRD
jgi:hypothetical protein